MLRKRGTAAQLAIRSQLGSAFRDRGCMTDTALRAEGRNGQLVLTDTILTIKRDGLMSLLTQGLKGDKEILVSQISSVQFKEAGLFFAGYIQFAFIGGSESKGGMWEATEDENTVVFGESQQPPFDVIRKEIMARIAKRGTPQSSAASGAEEVSRLAALHQAGHLTVEEFQAAKRKALGI